MSRAIVIKDSDIKNQRTVVMSHLMTHKNITSLEAIKEYGITRLASIIHGLRDEDYNIETQDITGKNRFGNSVTYANYIYHPPVIDNQLSLLDVIEEADTNSI